MKPLICTLALLVYSCTGVDLIDDYVPPTLRIVNAIEELPLGSSFQLNASYLNAVGDRIQEAQIQWKSLHPDIITVQPNGTITQFKRERLNWLRKPPQKKGF